MPGSESHAVVVGAGIGGLASALALRDAGWNVTVLERRASDSEAGSGISLWPNALRALAELGVDQAVLAGAALGGRSGVRTPAGAWIARTDIGGAIADRHGLPLVLIHRQRLVAALRERLGAERIRFETPVHGVEGSATDAVVTTTDGVLRADLVVAADGARSRLRRQLFPEHPGLRHAGYTTWRMVAPRTDGIEASETWGSNGRRFALLPLDEHRLYCYATANEDPGSAALDERDALRERFGSWHAPIPDLIDSLAPDAVIRSDVNELSAPLAVLHRDRTVLVGDAAHAMTPDLGQGGCQALEDAVTLGAVMRGDAPIGRALERYSAVRAPRGADLIRRSHAAGRIYQAPPWVARTVARAAGRLPPRLTVRALDPVLAWRPPQFGPSSSG
ncbi:FAD-dependent monooxygenase [Galbitalea sp. SE-J8]|uniref:FAD-dependent oxidoreductase n=1 Tax=Galbitalea sp. SE-J8 TaxID=3054952 RepID=UPI00259CFDDF|nr:FAD-dependent oxidoreductase [Galbitalea sp. SE-J8]MDM4761978.1 FAD-dependent monooxygenase [Galbitalea sp. SE-J8]